MENAQEQHKEQKRNYDWLKGYQFVKGQSGNPGGRKKGSKSLKTFAREYLESLPDDEKVEYLKTLPEEMVWKMAEGNPEQTQTHEGSVEVKLVNYGHINNPAQLPTEGLSTPAIGSPTEVQDSGVPSESGQK